MLAPRLPFFLRCCCCCCCGTGPACSDGCEAAQRGGKWRQGGAARQAAAAAVAAHSLCGMAPSRTCGSLHLQRPQGTSPLRLQAPGERALTPPSLYVQPLRAQGRGYNSHCFNDCRQHQCAGLLGPAGLPGTACWSRLLWRLASSPAQEILSLAIAPDHAAGVEMASLATAPAAQQRLPCLRHGRGPARLTGPLPTAPFTASTRQQRPQPRRRVPLTAEPEAPAVTQPAEDGRSKEELVDYVLSKIEGTGACSGWLLISRTCGLGAASFCAAPVLRLQPSPGTCMVRRCQGEAVT